MADTELKPQTPGETAGDSRLETLLEGTVPEVTEELEGLSDSELEQLAALEKQGSDRKMLLGAISREQARREVDGQPEPTPGDTPNVYGNVKDYRNTPASQIDPKKLPHKVLSKDGWVLPPQRAEG